MAKRFTDSEKWSKPFIRNMKSAYKLLWLYMLDECNHAGIWQVDLDVAQLKMGEKLNYGDAINFFGAKIYAFDNNEKWFIPDFIEFQYGDLNPENRAHNSVIVLLNKYNLMDVLKHKIKPLTSPLQGAMDMDKDKDMVKDIVLLIEDDGFKKFKKWIGEKAPNVLKMKEPFTSDEYLRLKSEFGISDIQHVLQSMHNHAQLLKKYVSANLTFRTFMRNHLKAPSTKNGKQTVSDMAQILHETKQELTGNHE